MPNNFFRRKMEEQRKEEAYQYNKEARRRQKWGSETESKKRQEERRLAYYNSSTLKQMMTEFHEATGMKLYESAVMLSQYYRIRVTSGGSESSNKHVSELFDFYENGDVTWGKKRFSYNDSRSFGEALWYGYKHQSFFDDPYSGDG